METPKEKAESLVEKFKEIRVFEDVNGGLPLDDAEAIECAKITVNEITRENLVIDTGGISDAETVEKLNKRYIFWKEVKEELNKL